MLKVRIMLAVLALTGFAGAPLAQAQMLQVQFFGEPESNPVPPPPGVDAGEWDDEAPPRPARVCQKLCANDYSPCDPIYFKTEDGRCDGLDISR
jgi:hypothetical protein